MNDQMKFFHEKDYLTESIKSDIPQPFHYHCTQKPDGSTNRLLAMLIYPFFAHRNISEISFYFNIRIYLSISINTFEPVAPVCP